jgi:carlactone C-19 oxidase
MRNTILSLYQPSHLAGLVPTMQRCVERAAEGIQESIADPEHGDLDFADLSLKLATDVIGQAAFGVDFGLTAAGGEAAEFVREHVHSTTSLKMDLSAPLSVALGLVAPALQGPARRLLSRVPGTADWRVARTNARLRARVDEIVAARARSRAGDGEGEGKRKDFLSAVLDARERSAALRELLTPDHVSALTYEHLLAGSATTAFTLASAVYLVAGHPEVEAKLLEEVDRFGPVPTAEDLRNKFPYLDQASSCSIPFHYSAIDGTCLK